MKTAGMTSGGETADHFLTVRNLKAAMGDGLRDSMQSIKTNAEKRLETAMIGSDGMPEYQHVHGGMPDSSQLKSPKAHEILEIQRHPRVQTTEDMYAPGQGD